MCAAVFAAVAAMPVLPVVKWQGRVALYVRLFDSTVSHTIQAYIQLKFQSTVVSYKLHTKLDPQEAAFVTR